MVLHIRPVGELYLGLSTLWKWFWKMALALDLHKYSVHLSTVHQSSLPYFMFPCTYKKNSSKLMRFQRSCNFAWGKQTAEKNRFNEQRRYCIYSWTTSKWLVSKQVQPLRWTEKKVVIWLLLILCFSFKIPFDD